MSGQLADLVIIGHVLRVEKDGAPYSDSCYQWQNYRAGVAVNTQIKGWAKTKVITVKYPMRIKDLQKCDGGKTSYALSPGVKYELYLREVKAPRRHFEFINWNGVKRVDK